jgi:hypothetical protein
MPWILVSPRPPKILGLALPPYAPRVKPGHSLKLPLPHTTHGPPTQRGIAPPPNPTSRHADPHIRHFFEKIYK